MSESTSKIATLRQIAIVAACMLLISCADTGPQKIGRDAYSISTRVALSGPAGAKGEALQEANKYCESQNKEVLLQTENSSECALHGGCGEAEITFLCVADNDPRYLEQHQMRKDNGDSTIEIRQN
jgi:hypothetical protein